MYLYRSFQKILDKYRSLQGINIHSHNNISPYDICLCILFFKAHRLEHFELRVARDDQYNWEDEPVIQNFTHCLTFRDRFPGGQLRTFLCEQPVVGRYFMVTIPAQIALTLCEVEVFGERGEIILHKYCFTQYCSDKHANPALHNAILRYMYSVIYIEQMI